MTLAEKRKALLVEAIAEEMWLAYGAKEGDWYWLNCEFPAQAAAFRNRAEIALDRGGYHTPWSVGEMDMSFKEAFVGGPAR